MTLKPPCPSTSIPSAAITPTTQHGQTPPASGSSLPKTSEHRYPRWMKIPRLSCLSIYKLCRFFSRNRLMRAPKRWDFSPSHLCSVVIQTHKTLHTQGHFSIAERLTIPEVHWYSMMREVSTVSQRVYVNTLEAGNLERWGGCENTLRRVRRRIMTSCRFWICVHIDEYLGSIRGVNI